MGKCFYRTDIVDGDTSNACPLCSNPYYSARYCNFSAYDTDACNYRVPTTYENVVNVASVKRDLPKVEPENSTENITRHALLCDELGKLYAQKNHDYGDSFHITFKKYGLVMSAVRLGDKFQRFENLIKKKQEVGDESIRDTLIDLANYALMTVMELDREEEESL